MLITTRKCLCATSELSLIDKFVYLSVLFLILIFASAGIFALVRNMLGVVLFMVTLYSALISGTELTFELPDKEKQCFYEELEEGVTFHVDYQVIAGGHYDVDCFVTDPVNNVLYEERKKQYDSLTHTTAMKGVYKVCFSNEFSTFSHKTVYLDFRSGPDDRLLPGMNNPTALTQIESTCISIHEILKVVADTQTKYRLREALDRIRAEDLNAHISYWSIGEAVIICVVSIGQVLMLKSFFKEKKTSSI